MKRTVLQLPHFSFVALVVLAACGEDATSPENVRPVSSFSYECAELTCSFTNLSYDEDGPLITSVFNFGDLSESAEPDPTHTYQVGGTYTVSLVVQDLDGARVGSEQDVSVNSTPHVRILFPLDGEEFFEYGAPVTFRAAGEDLESETLSYAWFLVEGTKLTFLANTIEFTTSDLPSGIQTVQVNATDGDGATATASTEVEIGDPPVGP